MLTSLLSRNLRHQRYWRHYGHRVRYQMTNVEAKLLIKQQKSLVDLVIWL